IDSTAMSKLKRALVFIPHFSSILRRVTDPTGSCIYQSIAKREMRWESFTGSSRTDSNITAVQAFTRLDSTLPRIYGKAF
ncbi:MAG: hypothetical protein NTV51_04150, partial [Verrucomicrobia bacterium]|nr:hypothetical protein [Verrucomicrobiota bacterium]